MRVTFVVPKLAQNGGHRVVAIYAQKLLDMGHDVKVVEHIPPEARGSGISKAQKLLSGRKRKPDAKAGIYYAGLGERVIKAPRYQVLDPSDVPDADIVVATWWRTAFSVATLPPEKGVQAFFVQHHEVHDHLPWDLSRGSYYLPLKKITIADWLVETMAGTYGDTDVIKVENSVDTEQFNAPPRMRNSSPRVGLLYSPKYFKGLDISLRAIEVARRRFPDLQVLAFGAQAPTPDLALPEGSAFHQLPDQDTLRSLYAQCDVWLCGSRAEGFHLPPLEAMACRCPVVGTRVGGVVEIVTEGRNGYTAEVEDAEALGARLIDVLATTDSEWRMMSDAAYARAHEYSWADAARAFEQALLQIIAQH